jgi:hypothetical protein
MERRKSTRDGGREKSRSKTSSKPAMAGLYTLSRAPPAARPVPARPARSHRKDWGGGGAQETGRRRKFSFLLFLLVLCFSFSNVSETH